MGLFGSYQEKTVTSNVGILIFSGHSFGGIERRFARLAAYLIKKGEPVHVYCTADAEEVMRRIGIIIPDRSIYIFDYPSSGFWIFNKLNRIAGLIRLALHLWTAKPVRHMHLAMNPGLIATLFSFLRFPYSISVVDTYFAFRPWVFSRSVLYARFVDCLSETIACEVIRRLCGGKKLPPIKSGPCSFTDYSFVKIADVRDIDVALIARQAPNKGHELLRDALGSSPDIIIHDCPTDDPFGVLGRTKVFVSLQKDENYPSQALLEAMASECAIIATDVGETRKLVDESCGILVPYDPSVLAEAIHTLLGDDSLRNRLGVAARKRVLQTHTIERYSEYFWSLVSRM